MNLRLPILLLVAAPAEAEAVVRGVRGGGAGSGLSADWVVAPLTPRVHVARSGVGKVNAAIAAARLVEPDRYGAVISIGVCGALPRGLEGAMLPIGSVVIADRSVYADEGLVTSSGFVGIDGLGFAPGDGECARLGLMAGLSVVTTGALRTALERALTGATTGPIATVSTCSGTDAHAREVAMRTGAMVEAMEGAAVGQALARLHRGAVAFAEVRVVSNTTGERAAQVWDLKGALARLSEVGAAISRWADQSP